MTLRDRFREAYNLFPAWARDLYGPWIAERLDDLDESDAFDADDAASLRMELENRLAAWGGGSLLRVPPPIERLPGEEPGAWHLRTIEAHCA